MKNLKDTISEALSGNGTSRGAESATIDVSRDPFTQELKCFIGGELGENELTEIAAANMDRWHAVLKIKDDLKKANKSGILAEVKDNPSKKATLKRGADAWVTFEDGSQSVGIRCTVEEFTFDFASRQILPVVVADRQSYGPRSYKKVFAI